MKKRKGNSKAGKKMTEINVDTNKMIEYGNTIISIANEVGQIIEELFGRIEQMPTVTKEWVGHSANEFVRRARIEKGDFINLKKAVIYYGKVLSNCGENYKNVVDRCKLR